jgi:hypothetical protein
MTQTNLLSELNQANSNMTILQGYNEDNDESVNVETIPQASNNEVSVVVRLNANASEVVTD